MPAVDLERRASRSSGSAPAGTRTASATGRQRIRRADFLIGRIGLLRHRDWTPGGTPVEVGWTLDRCYWGKGLATEGGRASMELWRKRLLDDHELISITSPGNVRSRAVMERLGLTLRGSTHWRGFDQVWYAIDR